MGTFYSKVIHAQGEISEHNQSGLSHEVAIHWMTTNEWLVFKTDTVAGWSREMNLDIFPLDEFTSHWVAGCPGLRNILTFWAKFAGF